MISAIFLSWGCKLTCTKHLDTIAYVPCVNACRSSFTHYQPLIPLTPMLADNGTMSPCVKASPKPALCKDSHVQQLLTYRATWDQQWVGWLRSSIAGGTLCAVAGANIFCNFQTDHVQTSQHDQHLPTCIADITKVMLTLTLSLGWLRLFRRWWTHVTEGWVLYTSQIQLCRHRSNALPVSLPKAVLQYDTSGM